MHSAAATTARSEGHGAPRPDAGGLFAEYSAQIFAYCLHNLGSRSDAEDALQTTFLQAHRALQRGVEPECESAWLTAIAKNACRWQRRTQARRATVSEASLDLAAFPAPEDADREGAVSDLRDALASIPERQRKALLLREWQGLQPSEIAPRLGASTSETYALLARARRSVASALTAAARRPVLGLDFGSLLLQLRSLLANTSATVGATVVAVAGLGAAGITVERAVTDHHSPRTIAAVVAHVSTRGVPAERGLGGTKADRPTRAHHAARPRGPTARVKQAHVRAREGRATSPAAGTQSQAGAGGTPGAAEPPAPAAPPVSSAPHEPAQAQESAPTPPLPPPPAVTVPDPRLRLPVQPSPPPSVVDTVTGPVPSTDPNAQPSDSPAPPLQQLPPPAGGLLP